MASIERSLFLCGGGNEKLGAVAVWSIICHPQQSGLVKAYLFTLIIKPASAIAVQVISTVILFTLIKCDITALHDKMRDDFMKMSALVGQEHLLWLVIVPARRIKVCTHY